MIQISRSKNVHIVTIVCSPFQKVGNPNFENFKKDDNLKKIGVGDSKKGGGRFSKIKWRTQLFKLNLGKEKDINGDF